MSTDPIQVFKHCPRCGGELSPSGSHSVRCGDCDFHLYFNCGASIACLIEDDQHRLLLTRRLTNPAKGTLDLPGGFVDPGETAEEALRRELREELNIEVTGVQFFSSFAGCYEYGGLSYYTLDLAFLCHLKSTARIRVADDVVGFAFCSLDDIHPAEIGLDSVREVVQTYITFRRGGTFPTKG